MFGYCSAGYRIALLLQYISQFIIGQWFLLVFHCQCILSGCDVFHVPTFLLRLLWYNRH